METNVLKTEALIKKFKISTRVIIILAIISFVVLTSLCIWVGVTSHQANLKTQGVQLLSNTLTTGKGSGITNKAYTAIGAGIASVSFIGAGIGQGYAAGQAASAVGRNPEAESQIRNMMFVGSAVAESSALYGFVIAIICLFVV